MSYICTDCAKENGATWPEGHVATFHEATCQYCNQWCSICHLSDWNWPKDSPICKITGEREV